MDTHRAGHRHPTRRLMVGRPPQRRADDLEAINPYRQAWCRSRAVPTQTSLLLKTSPLPARPRSPRSASPARPTRTTRAGEEGDHHQGHEDPTKLAGVTSENCPRHARTTAAADKIRDRKKDSETHRRGEHQRQGHLPPTSPSPPMTSGDMPTSTDGPCPFTKHIRARATCPASAPRTSTARRKGTQTWLRRHYIPFQGASRRRRSASVSQKDEMSTSATWRRSTTDTSRTRNTTNPARANYKMVDKILNDTARIAARRLHPGRAVEEHVQMNQKDVTTKALANYAKSRPSTTRRSPRRPRGAPDRELDQTSAWHAPVHGGLPLPKWMQGEWNNGMLGSRNYSAVRRPRSPKNLYTSTNKELMTGHQNSDPLIYSRACRCSRHEDALLPTYLGFSVVGGARRRAREAYLLTRLGSLGSASGTRSESRRNGCGGAHREMRYETRGGRVRDAP